MPYDHTTWKSRVDSLLDIGGTPDDIDVLERAQQALAIGHQPDASDQATLEALWKEFTDHGFDDEDDDA